MKRLKPLDIVRTSWGTICTIHEVSSTGEYSLSLPANSRQKWAWYSRDELVFIASLKDLVNSTPGLTKDKPKREKIEYPEVFVEMVKDLNDMYSDKFGNSNGRDHYGMN